MIHGPKDRVTPFDFKVQTFRVHVELPTHYHDLTQKKFFRAKRLLSDIFSKIFFRKLSSNMGIKQLRLTFLRTRIPSKKCPKVTFWLRKSLTRTVSMEKVQWRLRLFLVENPNFFKFMFQKIRLTLAIIFMSKLLS